MVREDGRGDLAPYPIAYIVCCHPANGTIVRYTYNALERVAMHKRMTITLDEEVYEGLYRTIGKRRMSQFIEDLLRPHVMDTTLDDGYRAMAADKAREKDALEWCNGLVGDMVEEAR